MNKERLLKSDLGEPTVRTMALPRDTNWLGDVFGGWLMSHADIAGAILAYRKAQGKVVTVAVKNFEFIQPVYTGDILTFFSKVKKLGNTSITVSVEIYAERPGGKPGEHLQVARAEIVYVHINEDRSPCPLPA